jgi:ABC-type antimicrobial peptide transport system permease subunit
LPGVHAKEPLPNKTIAMIKNYLKIALRNLTKNKVYSIINIGGLAVGMAVAILLGLWIHQELSFNRYHQNYPGIARVMERVTVNGKMKTGEYMPAPLASAIRQSYPEDFTHVVQSTFPEEHTLAKGETKINSSGMFMEPDGPAMLTLKILKGSSNGLKDPYSILLSSSLAKGLFGNEDAMNKTLRLDNKADVTVKGIYEDIPRNSDFNDLLFVGPWDLNVINNPWMNQSKDDWNNNRLLVFVQVSPITDFETAGKKIKDIKLNHVDDQNKSFKPEILLHPMSRWHLYNEFKNGVNAGGAIQYVWLFGIIGVFVLLLACINFMNLSTARSEKRAREIGIRKAVGSVRRQLIHQFLSESILVACISFVFSIVLVHLIMPWFNEVANTGLKIAWTNPLFWLISIGFILITGLIAGSYPALYLSSFQPIKVLKGRFLTGRYAALPRKVLVVIQFTVSISLIIGTIIVFRQIQFTKNRPSGYNRDGLIYLKMQTNDIHDHYDAFRNELLETGVIVDVTESNGSVTETAENSRDFSWSGKDPDMKESFSVIRVSHSYGKTVGWELISGRDFVRSNATDSSGLILNESAAKLTAMKDPLGEIIRHGGKDYKVLGVVKDMLMRSPFDPPRQSIFSILPWRGGVVTIKIKPTEMMSSALSKVGNVFNKYAPAMPFDYKFADLEYAKKFSDEVRIGKLSSFFAILAIFISCLGLFGLASFIAEQRAKEIGLRKVMGASVFNLWRLMSKDFLALVILSCLIAIPTAYYFLHGWLQKYEYRTEISWWIFLVAIGTAMLITLLTVSFQAIKAAVASPIKSLRAE